MFQVRLVSRFPSIYDHIVGQFSSGLGGDKVHENLLKAYFHRI